MAKKKQELNDDDGVLERFMKEFFDFNTLKKVGFFTKEMKGDYKAQAKRVSDFFGYKTVYEYGTDEVRCHISYANKEDIKNKPFIMVVPNIYE